MQNRFLNMLKNPSKLLYSLGSRGYLKFLSDETFLKNMYSARMDRKLNLENPTTFNEKLQWLKLHDKNPLYPKLVDKFEVRDFIKSRLGEEYLVPLLGSWDKFEDINFSELPEQFVLKTTHDSGGVVICSDRENFNAEKARIKINKSLRRNYYDANREWVYKDLAPRIIAEKYMVKDDGEGLDDYKFFCFNGKVKALFVATERNTNTKFDFFDPEFNKLPVKQFYPNSKKNISKPKNLEKMIAISEELSKEIPHVRVDLYNKNGEVYFGELTFFHFSGAIKFEPEKYDDIFGEWIDLSLVQDF